MSATAHNDVKPAQERVWLDTKQLSEYTGLPCRTIQYLRQTGEGPKFALAGRRPLYRIAHVDEWLANRTVASTSEARRSGWLHAGKSTAVGSQS